MVKSRLTIRGFHDLALDLNMFASTAVFTIRCGMCSTASRPSVYATHPRHGKATPFGSLPLEAAPCTPRQAFRFDSSVYACRWSCRHMSMILRKAVKKKQFTRCRRVCSTQQFQTLCIQHLQSSEKNNSPHPLESLCRTTASND